MSTHPYPILSSPVNFTANQSLSITANGVTESITAIDAGVYYGWDGTESIPLGNSLLAEFLSNLTDHSEISAVTLAGSHDWTQGYPRARLQFTKGGDDAGDEIDWSSNSTLAAALGFDNVPLSTAGAAAVDVSGDYALGNLFVGACHGIVNGKVTPKQRIDASLSQPSHNRTTTNYHVTRHGGSTLLVVDYDLVDEANIYGDLRRDVQSYADFAGVDVDDPNNLFDAFLDVCANGALIRIFSADSTYKTGLLQRLESGEVNIEDFVSDDDNGRASLVVAFWEQSS